MQGVPADNWWTLSPARSWASAMHRRGSCPRMDAGVRRPVVHMQSRCRTVIALTRRPAQQVCRRLCRATDSRGNAGGERGTPTPWVSPTGPGLVPVPPCLSRRGSPLGVRADHVAGPGTPRLGRVLGRSSVLECAGASARHWLSDVWLFQEEKGSAGSGWLQISGAALEPVDVSKRIVGSRLGDGAFLALG